MKGRVYLSPSHWDEKLRRETQVQRGSCVGPGGPLTSSSRVWFILAVIYFQATARGYCEVAMLKMLANVPFYELF